MAILLDSTILIDALRGRPVAERLLRFEGTHEFRPLPGEATAGIRPPVLDYSHAEGCSVIGGRVYRGPVAALRGLYVYADECGGWIESFRPAASLNSPSICSFICATARPAGDL